MLVQAILRAIGRIPKGGLLPNDQDGLYLTDKLMEDASDLREASYKCFVSWGAPQEAADEFVETILPRHLANLERQLKNIKDPNGWCYFVGDMLTLADV